MKGTPFQYVIMGIFVALLVGGILFFAAFGSRNKQSEIGKVVIWGTVDRAQMDAVIAGMITVDDTFHNVTYVQKKPETYESDLVDAFASGKSPDLFMLDDTQIVSFMDKVTPISYSTVSERTFTDTYVNEGSIFMFGNGIMGLPIFVDPLVMYWNKDLFAGSGIATYPRLWSELPTIATKMTAIDTAKVRRSAVALGTYDNIRHAQDIMQALFLQLGNAMAAINSEGSFVSTLASTGSQNNVESPAQTAVRFYTSFSNPSQSSYSWNRSLPNSFNAFTSGDVGIYFGLSSDYGEITTRNPNLAFGVAPIPQTGAAKAPATYGRITALAVPRVAPNQTGAIYIAQVLSGATGAATLAERLGLPPARRDLLSKEPSDAAQSVFYQSSLIARGWYDPGRDISGPIIKTMIESTISGKSSLGEAINDASMALDDAFTKLK